MFTRRGSRFTHVVLALLALAPACAKKDAPQSGGELDVKVDAKTATQLRVGPAFVKIYPQDNDDQGKPGAYKFFLTVWNEGVKDASCAAKPSSDHAVGGTGWALTFDTLNDETWKVGSKDPMTLSPTFFYKGADEQLHAEAPWSTANTDKNEVHVDAFSEKSASFRIAIEANQGWIRGNVTAMVCPDVPDAPEAPVDPKPAIAAAAQIGAKLTSAARSKACDALKILAEQFNSCADCRAPLLRAATLNPGGDLTECYIDALPKVTANQAEVCDALVASLEKSSDGVREIGAIAQQDDACKAKLDAVIARETKRFAKFTDAYKDVCGAELLYLRRLSEHMSPAQKTQLAAAAKVLATRAKAKHARLEEDANKLAALN
jgi:hypothetical protein